MTKLACPHCKKEIELNESLTVHLKADIEKEFSQKILNLQNEVEKTKENTAKELELKLQEEKKKLWKIALEKAEEKQSLEFKDLKDELKEKAEALKKAEELELELRKKQREMLEKEQKMELELQRQIEKERQQIESNIRKIVSEEERMKLLEKDKQLEMMRKQIETLKQKSEQGSMQIQGEVQEEDLKNILQSSFVYDEILDVPTGVNGADLIHVVKNNMGKKAGIIVLESKNTKAFSASWIKKLKDDRLKVNADICILITKSLPEGIESFGEIEGVWICSYQFVLPLVNMIRTQLIQLNSVKESMKGQDEKMNAVMEYLTGSQFKSRFENIISAFVSMKDELDKEKRAMLRIWSRREQEINRMLENSSGMYGDFQGIVGNKLTNIEQLELGSDGVNEDL